MDSSAYDRDRRGNVWLQAGVPPVSPTFGAYGAFGFNPFGMVPFSGGPTVIHALIGNTVMVDQVEQPATSHPSPLVRGAGQAPPAAPPVPILNLVSVVQVRPLPHFPVYIQAGVTPGPAAQPTGGNALSKQEPGPATAQLVKVGVQGPNVRPALRDTLVATQELPVHPGPRSAAGMVSVLTQPSGGNILLRQEQAPPTAAQLVKVGVSGPNVRIELADVAIVGQEVPRHPLPTGGASIQGLNIRTRVADTVWLVQEQPVHPLPNLRLSRQGPDVAPLPQVGRLTVYQEMPGYPPVPLAQSGVQGGPSVRIMLRDVVVVEQKWPDHPLPLGKAGTQGPNVAQPPQVGAVVLAQEQPAHPLPRGQASRQGPNVGVGITSSIQVGQLLPDHPSPRSGISLAVIPPMLPAVQRTWVLRQEQPYHPLPYSRQSRQGPNVRVLLADTALVRQDVPEALVILTRSGPVVLPRVLFGTRGSAPQSQPPEAIEFYQAGVPPSAGQQLFGGSTSVRQDQPESTRVFVIEIVSEVPPLLVNVSYAAQAQPAEPSLLYQGGVAGPHFRPPTSDSTFVRQRQPWHPDPSWLEGVAGPNVGPPTTAGMFAYQELPLDLLRELAGAGVFESLEVQHGNIAIVRVYEIYDHPLPFDLPHEVFRIADVGRPPRTIVVEAPVRTIFAKARRRLN